MRMILALVAAAVIVAPAMAAETISDPKALVSAIYDDYQPGKLATDPTVYYSTRLKGIFDQSVENKVFASDAAMTGNEFTPTPVFNPFLPDVSALLFDVVIGEPAVIDDRAVVNVSYHNFDQPRLVTIAMVREDGHWKVDDVASLGRDDHWLLSWALTFDPTGF